jgi:hypothetical protein
VTGVSGITGLSPAISAAATTDRLVYTAFERGDYNLYRLDGEEELRGRPIEEAIAGVSPAVLPPQNRNAGLVTVLLSEPELGLADTLTFNGANYRPGLSLDFVSQPQLAAGADRYGAFLAGGISLFFSDMLGNRNLSTVFNINTANGNIARSSAFVVAYENRRSRWNWNAEAGQVPLVTRRFGPPVLVDPEQGIFRETEIREWQVNRQATVGFGYPLSRANRVEMSAGFLGIDFSNEVRTSFFTSTGVEVERNADPRSALPARSVAPGGRPHLHRSAGGLPSVHYARATDDVRLPHPAFRALRERCRGDVGRDRQQPRSGVREPPGALGSLPRVPFDHSRVQ